MINDLSDLINIKNTNGDEEFTKNNNSLVWDADGVDIYYQGESQKELPIECNVKYELDGKVKIIVKYTNKDEHIVNIQGKETKLYTPFVVVCSTILDNTIHKNIEVSNGKIVNDGNKTFVLGMAFPGLQESLDISSDKISFSDTVEITMESNEFEISNITSFITPKVLEDEDLSAFDDLDNIYGKVNTLESSSKELENGANTLKSGVDTFYEKSQEFNSAMKQVSNGANTIYKSYSELDDGINTLNNGANELKNGAQKISEGTKAVSSALKTASSGANELKIGAEKLNTGLAAAYDKVKDLAPTTKNAKINSNTSEIESALETVAVPIKENVSKIVSDNNAILVKQENLLKDQKKLLASQKAILESITPTTPEITTQIVAINEQISSIDTQIKDINTQKQINTEAARGLSLELDKQLSQVANMIETNVSEKITQALTSINKDLPVLVAGIKEASEGANALYIGANGLNSGLKELSSKSNELADGAKELYNGTETLTNGSEALSEGSKEMKNGLSTLDNGATELANANDQLTNGAETLTNGAKTLASGVNRFNKEGINEICSYINGDVKTLTERVEKLKELANDYKTFTMLNDNTKGSVKFIMLMDGISAKDIQKEEIVLDAKKYE